MESGRVGRANPWTIKNLLSDSLAGLKAAPTHCLSHRQRRINDTDYSNTDTSTAIYTERKPCRYSATTDYLKPSELIFLFSYFLIFLFSYLLIFLSSYLLIFLSSYFLVLISGIPKTTSGKVRRMKNKLSLNPAYSRWSPLPKDQRANKRVTESPK